MLRNFFRRLMGHKKYVNDKLDVAIDSAASSGSQGKYIYMLALLASA